MRIKGTERTARDVVVEVDDTDMLEAMRTKVYQSVGLRPDMFLDSKGWLKFGQDHYNGSIVEVLVTKTPTELQVKTIEAFNHIRAMLIRD